MFALVQLKRFLLRYFPPGIILEYELRDRTREMKEIDLLHLTPETDVEVLVNQIVCEEPLISDNRKAKAVLGWEPKVSLRQGLERTIAFVRAHPELFRPREYAV